MITLIFDTETTGMVDWRHPDDHARQPHIVQLAAALFDGRELVGQMSTIICPRGDDGQVIPVPEHVAAIHGIDAAKAERLGISRRTALRMFGQMSMVAERIVAHNISFDATVIAAEWAREAQVALIAGRWDELPRVCTMVLSTPVIKISGPRGWKWPKLIEAHQYFTGEGFDGAHDAMADVQACARVLWGLEDGGFLKATAGNEEAAA